MNKDFYITNLVAGAGGPHIFTERLGHELVRQDFKYTVFSNNRLTLISGMPEPNKNNILRLDGLYFTKDHPENKMIFQSYKDFDYIVFQGEFCKLQYEAFTGLSRPHSIIRNGVSSIFFTETTPVERPAGFDKVVIASSKWRRHKRIEEVIEAFKSPKLKNVALVILGQYPEVDQENVFCFSKIHYLNLPQYYQMADAMIHLSWLDWCPNTVVEGLASRLPVLCSHNGGTKELVRDDGVTIQLEDDYQIGTELDLYNPPSIDANIIVEGVLDFIKFTQNKNSG